MKIYMNILRLLLIIDFAFVLTIAWLGFKQESKNYDHSIFTFLNTKEYTRQINNNEYNDITRFTNSKGELETSVEIKKKVIPMGNTTGIYVNTMGILVIDTSEITDQNGEKCRPAKNLLLPGDYIISVNDEKMKTKKQLIQRITDSDGQPLTFQVNRKGQKKLVTLTPVLCSDHNFKVGIWVRDDLQGLGTITYLDGNYFGALGHSINDMDIGELINVSEGHLYEADIFGVKKGMKGNPGVIEGMITYDEENVFGTITGNNQFGIYGTVNDNWIKNQENGLDNALEVGVPCVGEAQIQSYVSGEKKRYNIYIQKMLEENEKAFEIVIKDNELVDLTGGIIQGMSGSPIIQDGKLIGAVTHVFVDDPTRGYGIFIEEMMGGN